MNPSSSPLVKPLWQVGQSGINWTMVILFPSIHQELLGILMDRWFTLVDCGQSDSSLCAFINFGVDHGTSQTRRLPKISHVQNLVGNHEDEDKIIAQWTKMIKTIILVIMIEMGSQKIRPFLAIGIAWVASLSSLESQVTLNTRSKTDHMEKKPCPSGWVAHRWKNTQMSGHLQK